jgi:hypothetical protein
MCVCDAAMKLQDDVAWMWLILCTKLYFDHLFKNYSLFHKEFNLKLIFQSDV